MGHPVLGMAIRSSGFPQWRIAQFVNIPEWRLSKIIRRGGASADERGRLCRLLGIEESILFGPGPKVQLQADDQGREMSVKG
jgi:hypothetical protein